MTQREPRWLDQEQQRVWRAYLGATALVEDRLSHQLERDAHLSLSEYEVMVRLSETPESRMRMSQLADQLVHSRSRVTYVVRSMEKRGLVSRRACADDGRGVWCELTDQGWAVLRDAAPGHVEAVRHYLVDVLTPQQYRELGDIMTAIQEAVQDGRGQVAGAAAG